MYAKSIKRVLDFIIALMLLALFGWILAIVAVWLHFANKGAGVFFLQERPGKGETPFKIIKFKTMTDECDASGDLLPDAQRLTRVGRFVRATSLDELPQLINVLKGDMSFIGPRPLLFRYLPFYTEREHHRHDVRPGITGWSQIHGRNTLNWDDKLEMDVWYVEHISFRLDVKIFFKTILKVIKREGAIADKKENYFDVYRQTNSNR